MAIQDSTPAENPNAVNDQLACMLPRVLIVSRRTVRKNKFVDFVGEYHLDLIVKYGAVPVIVPRVSGLHLLLDSFEPIHGVLLCEGEDVDPSFYADDETTLSLTADELAEIKKLHSSDTSIDRHKDSIEFQLARRCLERNIPYLGICRGSQVLNVACGGSLYQDVEKELVQQGGVAVQHMNYDDYDGHRHPIEVVEGTPLQDWFNESFKDVSEGLQLNVNSYHHQGVKRLAARFKPMAFSPCGLIEAFYDPDVYNPQEGKFIVGLQFHPERMRHEKDNDVDGTHSAFETVFDYPGCARAYQEFAKAVIAYQKRLLNLKSEEDTLKLDSVMEKRRMKIVRSFCIAKNIYDEQLNIRKNRSGDDNGDQAIETILERSLLQERKQLEVGANFLQSMKGMLDLHQEKRLQQVGATVRNSPAYFDRMDSLKGRNSKARMMLERLGTHELHDLHEFYNMMSETVSEVLEARKIRNATASFS